MTLWEAVVPRMVLWDGGFATSLLRPRRTERRSRDRVSLEKVLGSTKGSTENSSSGKPVLNVPHRVARAREGRRG